VDVHRLVVTVLQSAVVVIVAVNEVMTVAQKVIKRCLQLRAQHVARGVKYHFDQMAKSQYSVEIVLLQKIQLQVILAALKEGRRVVVVWTSRERGKAFAKEYLEGSSYLWRFYSSESTREEQMELQDVEGAWMNVQCLMMTTTITIGINYNPRDETKWFDEAFLYGTSCSALPRDIAQALLRVRQLKTNRLTYVTDTRGVGKGLCGRKAVEWTLAAKEERLARDHPLVKWTTAPRWAKENHVLNENEMRVSRREYKVVLEHP
jgi:hypothetical protein